jgi:hypothetical protein
MQRVALPQAAETEPSALKNLKWASPVPLSMTASWSKAYATMAVGQTGNQCGRQI